MIFSFMFSAICSSIICSNEKKTNIDFSSNEKEIIVEQIKTETNEEIAKRINKEMFGDDSWNYLNILIGDKESKWESKINKYSGACGIFQRYVPKIGCPLTQEQLNDPEYQIKDGLTYIKNRYENPKEALKFREEVSWKINPNKKCRINIEKCKWY